MRTARKFGVVLGTVTLVLAALPGVAGAAAPSAPYDALTIDGTWSRSFDPGNSNVTFTPQTEGFQIGGWRDDTYFTAMVQAPMGKPLSVGTFPTTRFGDATHYGLDVSGDHVGCNTNAGSITIHEFTRDPATNTIASVAASYQEDACNVSHGELRWHSNRPYVSGVQSVSNLAFGAVDLGHSVPTQTVTFTGAGSTPINLGAVALGGSDTQSFTVTANTCSNVTLAYGQTCAITVRATPRRLGEQRATITVPDNTVFGKHVVPLTITGQSGTEGTFRSIPPYRVLDTRDGKGAAKAPIGPAQTLHLQVAGQGEVPFSGASAVVLNMTVVSPTSAGFLTVFPAGVPRPTASNLNFPAGWIGANAVTVPVGANGQVDIYNAAGNVNVVADVVGFYNAAGAGADYRYGTYWQTEPTRLLDTRDPSFGVPIDPFTAVRIPVDLGEEANPRVTALAVNVTAVNPTQGGYVTAWDGTGGQIPWVSTLNFTPHSIVPNFAIVSVSNCTQCGNLPSIAVANVSSGYTDMIVDIFGFYTDSLLPGGLRFHPLTPTRITDTRSDLGAKTFTGAGTATVTTPAAVAGANTRALVANVTGIDPSNSTYLTLWADGGERPTVSNLNLTPHEVRPNAAVVNVGDGNRFNVFNAAWKVDVVIDVAGTFEFLPGSVPAAGAGALNGQPRQFTPRAAGTPQKYKIG